MGITFTLDLENHRRDQVRRYEPITLQVLEILAERNIRGTFFVVADVARESRALIRRIAGAGHEIGFHGLEHRSWSILGPDGLAVAASEGRDILEDAGGCPVIGARAPYFSLTAETPWAPDVLAAAGYTYSSSVLPARNPMSGFVGAPRVPFRWPSGLVELPVPLASVGNLSVPILGGIYFRFAPWRAIQAMISDPRGQALWTYLHPYDLDTEEPFHQIHDAGPCVSRLLFLRRSVVQDRLLRLLTYPTSAPLSERLRSGEFDHAQVWPDRQRGAPA